MKLLTCSGLDSNKDFREKYNLDIVPLKITIDEKEYIDDENLDTKELLKLMKQSEKSPNTACPSPNDFIEKFNEGATNIVVTISSKLSGTYNSAIMAKDIYESEHKNTNVEIIDSLSASAGGVPIIMKVQELYNKGLRDKELIAAVNEFVSSMKTFFVIDSLENLAKAGRMSLVVEKIASLLDIKPVMQGEEGEIKLLKKVRGHKRAMKTLLDEIGRTGMNLEDRVLSISHSHSSERAEKFKKAVEESYDFKEIIVNDTLGLSTVYTGGGGIVISF